MDDKRKPGNLSGQTSALLAAALFGLSTPASKALLLNFSPVMLSGLLYLGAAIALLLYRALDVWPPWARPRHKTTYLCGAWKT
jgi:drug/metabolite transporter (DMT)-like permease